MDKNNNAEFDKYIKEFEQLGDEYLIGDKNDGIKRLLHNRDRYMLTLNELDLLLKSKKTKLRLLDIGTSPFTFILRKNYPNLDINSIDYTNSFLKACRREGINFGKVDLNNQNAKLGTEKFDIILFLETLEHISYDHRKTLEKIISSLKGGGYCILTTPNKYSPKAILLKNNIVKRFWSLFSVDAKSEGEFMHHLEYSLRELTKLIMNNFDIEMVQASHCLYYDTPQSALVYRKNKLVLKPILYFNYLFAYLVPTLRRGMIVVFRKKYT